MDEFGDVLAGFTGMAGKDDSGIVPLSESSEGNEQFGDLVCPVDIDFATEDSLDSINIDQGGPFLGHVAFQKWKIA